MIKFEVIKEQLPTPWASYLVNGVPDSLEEGEENEIAETLEHLKLTNCECVDVLDNARFAEAPIYLSWLLAGDYSTYIFHKHN